MEDTGPSPRIEARALSKRYGPVQALAGADFVLHTGEVHALLGENGAGKSTLSRMLAGVVRPDSGLMTRGGVPYAPASRRDAERCGVRMVMQELNLIRTLSVAENLFLDRLPHRLGWLDRGRLRQDARAALDRVGLADLDPAVPVGRLGVGRQQLVEIAAGLSGGCEVLILDEPTAALSEREVERLFVQIETLRRHGAGILYISHRLEEVARIADRITVLRDGRIVATRRHRRGAETPPGTRPLDDLLPHMIGRPMPPRDEPRKPATQARPKGVALQVRDLRAGRAVRGVSFDLHWGEVLGLAGLMGSGRTETLRAIFGADRRDAGTVRLGDASSALPIDSPATAVRAGLGLLTENRKEEGLLLPWPVRWNLTLAGLARVRSALGTIRPTRETAEAGAWIARLGVRCASVDQPVRELSGGNQQKVAIGKWLFRECSILMVDEPTRGIDVGAKREICAMLRALASQGKAVLVVSSELPELIGLCDRIAVLSAGRLVRVFDPDAFDPDAILRAALENYGGDRTASPAGCPETPNA